MAFLEFEDATALDPALLDERLTDLAHRPFDLERGPLLRVHLFRRSAHEHILLLVVHHIVADLWSLALLANELNELYTAERADRLAELAALPLHYVDYVRWQARMLGGPEGERLHAYWRQQLAGAPPALDLPTDRPRPPVQTYRGAAHPFHLDAELTEQLNALARESGATLYMTLLAAWQLLLHRYTGQDDLLVGTPTTGRSRAEFAGVIGYFVNMIVLRADLAGNPTFASFLERTRRTVLEAFVHQDFPFPLLVERLQPARDSSRSPIFQAAFALQKTWSPDDHALPAFALGGSGIWMPLADLGVEPLALAQRTAQFDLALLMAETSDGLVGTLQYNTDLFEAATIRRMAGHLDMLLRDIVAGPERPIKYLQMLTAQEQRQLLVDWNNTAADYPRDSCFQELFEEQAARTPNAVAVVCAGQQLSYRELNLRANQLAHELRRLGVGSDTLVGICAERSVKMIVGIMGILKAGGAYVPLDPSYPAERLRYMLKDSGASVVLIEGQVGDWSLEIAEQRQPPVIIDLTRDWPAIGQYSPDNPPRAVQPDNLAYVIYTSGSTGRPKGVMVTQRGLLNLCFGLRALFDDPAVATTALITSISFDISVNQIFPTLLFGRSLHIIPDAIKYDSRAFARYLAEHQIHLFDAVPSYLNAVLTEIAPDRVINELRFILVGGEKLERRLLVKIFDQLGPAVRIVNIYGLTEIADINAFAIIGAGDVERAITIGRPLLNNRIYLTDRFDNLQPVGVIGEICISGESLARGYLNRRDLTAEKFVPCPFAQGALMCRTGDMGRRLTDGTIELFGRIDHQVKLRGFRVEIGEIEALLDQHPAVRENVVVVREDVPGDQRLIAYIVPRDWGAEIRDSAERNLQSPISNLPQTLRAFLKQKLPEYMIPSGFVFLDGLPKTPNGKIDRRVLPAPDMAPTRGDQPVAAPRSPLEAQLAVLWSQVLGVEPVGIDDDFFELGGHSLMATRIIARVREIFQVELSLQKLFEEPTIAGMARLVEAAGREPAASIGGIAPRPHSTKSLEQILADLEGLSADEARGLLGDIEARANQEER
jgi:amino acid adenylation domain-containing protein